MKKCYRLIRSLLPLVGAMACSPTVVHAQSILPMNQGVAMAPDDWLVGKGRPWFYRGAPADTPSEITRREPTSDELPVVEKAKHLFSKQPGKVIALIDGREVVYEDSKAPAYEDAYLFSFSVGKTITSMAVGKAICAGKLQFSTRGDQVIPELKGKDLGAVTVVDLLKMASGMPAGGPGGTAFTPAQNKLWGEGKLNILDTLLEDRISRSDRGVFSSYKPGEVFLYKSTDPLTLGIMVGNATGVPFAQWVTENVLQAAGISQSVIIGVDKFSHVQADGNVRMLKDDWIRFAIWVKESSKEPGCFGDYVRSAMSKQISNGYSPASRKDGKQFSSYGYLTWTDNDIAPNTAWAVGWGGQRIGWNKSNDRIVIVFSNAENWMSDVYEIAKAWGQL
ncbi:serine hydrolase [Rhodoferax sp. TH121]|uniref:serine hydrolase domain-containing protein n=1 Tax=Rhodoferax sp. TH121 TaxID=2022803 RepID=UPI000B97A0A9|nr:serine hydrolase domain-containing protein [Rhodoferax sp. TH121]OYQ41220.1 serine hydrolase [Rhodoferax sp. TH121]